MSPPRRPLRRSPVGDSRRGSPSSSSDANSRSRRDRRASASPGLQFVTATSPEQMKDKAVMRNIRQHVMFNHVSQRRQSNSPQPRPPMVTRESSSSESAGHSSSTSSRRSPHFPSLEDQMSSFSVQTADASCDSRAFGQFQISPRGRSPDICHPTESDRLPYFQRRIARSVCQWSSATAQQHSLVDPISDNNHTTCVASAYQDLLDGALGDSDRTVTIRSQFLEVLNNSLGDTTRQTSGLTIFAATELLMTEMLSGNSLAFQAHSQGLDLIIQQRGGLWTLDSNANVASVISETTILASILNGVTAGPQYTHYALLKTEHGISDTAAQTFSPLDPSSREGSTLDTCSPVIRNIIRDMRDLTGFLLVDRGIISRADHCSGAGIEQSFSSRLADIQSRIFRLPAASDQGTPVSNDWVYESCRLSALIYTTAVFHSTSFSNAACHLQASPNSSFLESLSIALAHTDLSNDWYGLSGTLLWVALVGAAASHNIWEGDDYLSRTDYSSRRIFMIALVNALGTVYDDGSETQERWILRALLRLLQIQQVLGLR